jgi:hypothetical protein
MLMSPISRDQIGGPLDECLELERYAAMLDGPAKQYCYKRHKAYLGAVERAKQGADGGTLESTTTYMVGDQKLG